MSRKMTPLMCTQNGLSHVDYGVPLVAAKSTDFRTSTGKNHGFQPPIAQLFDCRVQARIKPELLDKDVGLKTGLISTHATEFWEKFHKGESVRNDRAVNCDRVDFVRSAQEKIFASPPPLKPPKISEMEESYLCHYWTPRRDECFNVTCPVPETFRPLQPNINPATKGFYKLLDIYLTENRLQYVPYTDQKLVQAQEDLITIYNASGKHKGLREQLPGKLDGNKKMYDKSVFKTEFPNRILSHAPKKVPHSGMTSEYQSNYLKPAYSDFYPYLQEKGIYFPDSLSSSSPWQDLCPPAMYCSENCHIGTGWPVRAVVDVNAPTKEHSASHSQICCDKIY